MMKKKLSLRALTRQVARLACIPLIALSFFSLISCSNDDDESDKVTEYALSDLYGYTFQGKISASSGNTLTPQLVIYDEKHLAWNMNTSGMNDSAFFYTAEQTKTNVYSLSWYTSESDFNSKTNSGMTVTLGINSATSVTVLVVSNSTEGTSSGMAGKPVPMTRTNEAKKTWTETNGNTSAESLPTETTATEYSVFGIYVGTASASSNYFNNYGSEYAYIMVTKKDDETVEATFYSGTWGSGTFSELSVSESESSNEKTFTLAGNGTQNMSMSGTVTNGYDAAFSGNAAGGKLTATVTIPNVMGGTIVSFTTN